MKQQVIIFLGPPGSGKGTQAAKLSSALGIPSISTGELLRQECKAGSELGRAVRSLLEAGQLVSDDLMNQLVADRVSRDDCSRACILDGYPRTVSQARYLQDILSLKGLGRCTVFDFSISGNEVVERLSRRRQCSSCGRIYALGLRQGQEEMTCQADGARLMRRDDDNPATILERLRVYRQHASELVRFYRQGEYHMILAGRAADEITAELLDVLDGSRVRKNRAQPAIAMAAV